MIKYIAGLMLAFGMTVASAEPNTISAVAPNGAVITLTQEQGPCAPPAKVVHWQLKSDKVDGCWKLEDELVKIAWLDGDSNMIPVKVFTKKPTL